MSFFHTRMVVPVAIGFVLVLACGSDDAPETPNPPSDDSSVLWVADYRDAVAPDCTIDPFMFALVNQAAAPFLPPGQTEVDVWLPYAQESCQGSDTPEPPSAALLAEYEAVLWTVSPHGDQSALGKVTTRPGSPAPIDPVLADYVDQGGKFIVWGDVTIGALLGDFYPSGSWKPELPPFPDANFGPGTFVWDVLNLRTQLDVAGRGTARQVSAVCSGLIGIEATAGAIAGGFPGGIPDPTGYDPSRSAIWIDGWLGEANAEGIVGTAGMIGAPSLSLTGLDSLYVYVTNSWSYEQGGPARIQEACGTSFLSPFESRPVAIRYADPAQIQGRLAWLGVPLDVFDRTHDDDVAALLRRLVAWVMEE